MNDVQAHPALARRTDPATSHAAARGVHVTNRQAQVLRILHANPAGLTNSEIAECARLPRDSVSPRIPSLLVQGLVADSYVRRQPGAQLRAQIVWRLTESGRAFCRSALEP